MIVGLGAPDDAGVFRLDDRTALIQTLDFLTPVTDSPYEFGQIAAANALSDVYAMGGTPITAMNIVCFPSTELPESILIETLRGGLDKINEAGAALAGGHSVDDPEFKYGLSVTGIVHPDKILTNSRAASDHRIILTKPLGTGILSTAIKAGMAGDETVSRMVAGMSRLNSDAARIMSEYRVSACTDVTGFGLAGHLLEMAMGSKKRFILESGRVPVLTDTREFAMMGMIPAGAHKNRQFFQQNLSTGSSVKQVEIDIFFDPQTSGGLLICVHPDDAGACVSDMKKRGIPAEIIGHVGADHGCGVLDIF